MSSKLSIIPNVNYIYNIIQYYCPQCCDDLQFRDKTTPEIHSLIDCYNANAHHSILSHSGFAVVPFVRAATPNQSTLAFLTHHAITLPFYGFGVAAKPDDCAANARCVQTRGL